MLGSFPMDVIHLKVQVDDVRSLLNFLERFRDDLDTFVAQLIEA